MSQATTKAPPPTRRRFAPIPVETTFARYRRNAPAGEPTPSPSPRSPSPPARLWTQAKEKRRFAPQLIESSRRSRRTGDVGPATKPADKTDITPYHNHIYAPKTRKKHRKVQSLARRESCEEETASHYFDLLAREAEKRLLEDAALAAFPNSRARAGGAEHFAIREGSDDDSSATQSSTAARARSNRGPRRSRRDSYTEDVGWAIREMQEHHEQLVKARASPNPALSMIHPDAHVSQGAASTAATADKSGPANYGPPDGAAIHLERISTLDVDSMVIESPPNDPIWTTTRKSTHDSPALRKGEDYMSFIPEEPLDFPNGTDAFRGVPLYARKLREAEGDMDVDDGDNDNDFLRLDAAHASRPTRPGLGVPNEYSLTTPAAASTVSAGQLPAEIEFRGRNPFASYRNRDVLAEKDVARLRRKSPPMLGKDLVFPKCASPQVTKTEPEHLWSASRWANEEHRDATGVHGLWQGYCYSREKNEALVPIDRPLMLATPYPPSSPDDPFAQAFSKSAPDLVFDEPKRAVSDAAAGPGQTSRGRLSAGKNMAPTGTLSAGGAAMSSANLHNSQPAAHQHYNGGVLMGLDERLQQEKVARELEEKIMAEFTDSFVTQVYNYLSLGYPSMARAYDDELSKISLIPIQDLESKDGAVLEALGHTTGHIALEDDDEKAAREGAGQESKSYNHEDNIRWRALKLYIYEWARQHPDLDSVSPLDWGVRERRGSWGV